jgi:hypothetical protein
LAFRRGAGGRRASEAAKAPRDSAGQTWGIAGRADTYGNRSPNAVTPYGLDLSVSRVSSTVDLSLGIRHKVDLQPLMEHRRNALEHGERMAVVVGVF